MNGLGSPMFLLIQQQDVNNQRKQVGTVCIYLSVTHSKTLSACVQMLGNVKQEVYNVAKVPLANARLLE